MSWINGFVMSVGMFSIIPVPHKSWNDKYMPMVIPAMPFVGLLIGLVWYGSAYLLSISAAPATIQGAITLFIPLVLCGFIHADGYMDTADAVFSRRGADDKRRILKDPHTGAFAVVAIAGLLIIQFCSVYEIMDARRALTSFIYIPVMSRCVAGAAMLNMKPMFDTGFCAMFKKGARRGHKVFIYVTASACVAAVLLTAFAPLLTSEAPSVAPGLSVTAALLAALAPILVTALAGIAAMAYLYRQFDGVSGDLCGCAITVGEFAGLLCAALI